MTGGKDIRRGGRRKRFAPFGNGEVANCYSSAGEDEKISGKDIKDDNICQSACKEDEISKLRELNRVLLEEIQSSREEKAILSQKLAQMQSQTNNIEAVKEKFQSEMDHLYGDLMEQGILSEELKERLKESERDTEELKEQFRDLFPHYKVTRHSLQQENEMLLEELDSTRRLLEIQIKRVEEQNVESGRLKKQVEELRRLSGGLRDKNMELLKKIEQQRKMIESLQKENVSLGSEKSLLLRNLDEVTKRSEEISEKCLGSNLRMLELESQSWGLHAELTAAKSAYDEVTSQLNKIKEDMDKLSNDSYQIEEEKEVLEKNLMLQLSRNKELEEELLNVKSSFEEMKVSASKGEHQMANLQSQVLVAVEEKYHQIFDTQSQLSAMIEQKRIQLPDLHDQLSTLTEAKKFHEENTKLEGRTSVYEKEQVCLNGRIRKLERALDFLNKNFESSRIMTVEKEGLLADLQYHFSDLAKADKGIGEKSFKNNFSLTQLNKCTMDLETRDWGSALDSLNKDTESRDIQLQHPKSEGQASQSHVPAENGKPIVVPQKPKQTKLNGLHGNGKPNVIHEKTKPNGMQPNGVHNKRTPRQMTEKQKQKIWSP